MMEYLNVIAIIVAGLMVGSELAIAAFVHPTLDRLPHHGSLGNSAHDACLADGDIHLGDAHKCNTAEHSAKCGMTFVSLLSHRLREADAQTRINNYGHCGVDAI